MKRLSTTALAALMVVGSLGVAPAYAQRWNDRDHNGYTENGRWHYGPMPAGHRNARPGYHAWRRGERLPSYYRSRYVVVNDWNNRHLRRPPRGYHYVRDDRGDILLVAVATGLIASIIANS